MTMLYATPTALFAGGLLDLLLGDPVWLPHPVRGTGRLISFLEQQLRRIRYERFAGCVLCCLVVVTAAFVAGLTVYWGGILASIYWIFTTLAVRSLDRESRQVIEALRAGDL